MINKKIILYSTVRSNVKKRALFRGTFIAALGITPLVLAGVFLPVSRLTILGPLLYLLAGLLITVGLMPYRKLCLLERTPSTLHLEDTGFTACLFGRAPEWISWDQVDWIRYHNDSIEVMLKKGMLYSFDYFSKHAFLEMQEVYRPD